MGLFGPSKNEVWKQLSDEIHSKYVDSTFWNGSRVEAKHNNWTLYLDTYTVSTGQVTITYTRMRAPFVDKNGFYFKIYKKSIFSGIGKLLGMQDIEVGFEPFDEQYIIKGNDERTVKKLFSNYKIRELIERQPKVSIEVKKSEGYFGPEFAGNEGELYFLAEGIIKDIGTLKNLFELFSELLEALELIGIASSQEPRVKLFKD